MNYSHELKEAILRRLLPPNNESITKVSREEGISEQTLRNWRDKVRADGKAAPGTDAVPDDWSTQDKFLTVVETAGMNETELAEYARKKGLYVEQIQAWKDACMNANGGVAQEAPFSDLYDRSIVGWEVYEEENADLASDLIKKTTIRQQRLTTTPLVLHSDNGYPMKGATMLVTLYQLGITPSNCYASFK